MTLKTKLLVKSLKRSIFKQKSVKDYFLIMKNTKNNQELQTFYAARKFHQKNMTMYENTDDYLNEKKQYDYYNNIIVTHPLVSNLEITKDELKKELNLIKDILSL